MKPSIHPYILLVDWTKMIAMVLCLGLFQKTGTAQELHLYYDLFTEKLEYQSEGKTLSKPKLKKGGTVYLHLTEFNSYLYDVEIEVNESSASKAGGGFLEFSKMLGLMPGFDGLMGVGETEDENEGGSFLDIPLITLNNQELTLKNLFGKGSRGAAEVMDQTNAAMTDVARATEEIQMVYNELKNYEKAIRVSHFAGKMLDRLKNDPALKPSAIKSLCSEYYEALFFKSPEEALSLDDVLTWQEMPTRYTSLHKNLQMKQTGYGTKVKNLHRLTDQLTAIEVDDEAYELFTEDALKVSKQAADLETQLKNWLAENPADMAKNQVMSALEMTDLQLKFSEVLTNNFTYETTIPTSNEVIRIKAKVKKKITDSDMQEIVVKEKTFDIEATGGLKLSAGVGVNFGQFFTNAQSFDVRDGAIIAEDEGLFNPAITSFMHFYAHSRSKMLLGGSFGMGLPILGTDNGQSINFYLGPSLYFGGGHRIILTGGVMGGKVNRLARGFKPGDAFDLENGDIPMRNRYELGFFTGISFNFTGN